MILRRPSLLAALSLSALVLAGCGQDHYDNPSLAMARDNVQGRKQAVESRLTTAAAEAIAAGRTADALTHYEKLYRSDKKDPINALNFAQLLRRSARGDEAIEVLHPFIKASDKKSQKISPLLLNEYAAALVEKGQLSQAQKIIDRVLADEEYANSHADAMNLLGVALDAQGRHKEAETMFRMALQGWNGNPTTVMNNLALCLANQAMFDEALTTLRQALVMAPDKQEIARNIQLVSELRDSVVQKPVSLKN